MQRVVVAVLASLVLAAAAHAQAVFETPPTNPAAPVAGQAVSARLFDQAACGDEPVAVEHAAQNVINLRYVPANCPILPPGVHQEVPLGVLAAGTYDLRLIDITDPQHPQLDDEAIVSVAAAPCQPVGPVDPPPPPALCLQNGRFAVTAVWEAYDRSTGFGQPVQLTPDSGAFWFFGADNYEVVVKVLDACAKNDRFWVYGGGLTDIAVAVNVHDNVTGTDHQSITQLGTPFEPIRDSSTFPCEAPPHS
jgi:hypothetical protein